MPSLLKNFTIPFGLMWIGTMQLVEVTYLEKYLALIVGTLAAALLNQKFFQKPKD